MEAASRELPRLLTADEVARQTGLSKGRIYELAREEDMPHVRLGRAVRFDPVAVREWIASGGTGSSTNGAS